MKIGQKHFLSLAACLFLFYFQPIQAQKMDFYTQKWKIVDKFDKKSLPKSALNTVEEIYRQAQKEKLTEQIIKSCIFRLKYKSILEEEGFEGQCKELETIALKEDFPTNAILQTMLADMYMMYYHKNRYKFLNRTNTINLDPSDMQTWTLDFLVHKILKAYALSLHEKKKLQKIPIKKYQILLKKGNCPARLRPTLYDFLVHKAIDFMKNPEMSLSQPADYFEIKEDFYFSDSKDFVRQKIYTDDSLSMLYHASLLFQEALGFRLSEKESEALPDLDLKRLQFAYDNSVSENKSALYEESLLKLIQKYPAQPICAKIHLALAKLYENLSDNFHFEDKSSYIYKDYRKKSVKEYQTIIKKFPKSNAATFARSYLQNITSPSLKLQGESNVAPEENFVIHTHFQNVATLYFRVASIDRKTFKNITRKMYGKKRYAKLKEASKTIYEFNKKLPIEKDYNPHATDLIFKAPEQPGLFLIFSSNNAELSYKKGVANYMAVNSTRIAYASQVLKSENSIQYFLADRITGQGLPGVECKWQENLFDSKKRKYEWKTTKIQNTDNQGFVKISHPIGSNARAVFYKGNDWCETPSNYYGGQQEHSEDKARIKTVFFTDRSIYRPGQTVHFKGIIISSLNDTHLPEKGRKTTVILRDANGQEVSKLNLMSNDYGTFSGSFILPTQSLNGSFSLSNEDGHCNLLVEAYKRPKFEVKMNHFDGNYRLNEPIRLQGKSVSFSGQAISEAEVSYRVIRHTHCPGYHYYYRRKPEVEIAHGKTRTNATGEFKIPFKAIPDLSVPKSKDIFFSYQITVNVTDISGETQSTESIVNVGYRSMNLRLEMPEVIDKDAPNEGFTYALEATNLNNETIHAKGKITLYKQKAPKEIYRRSDTETSDLKLYSPSQWNNKLPDIPYAKEDKQENFPKEEEVFSRNFDTKASKTIKLTALKQLTPGYYCLEINSTDPFGNTTQNTHYFKLIAHKKTDNPLPETHTFLPLKTDCNPGEQAMFLIGTAYKNQPIIYQIEHKGKIISSEILTCNQNHKLIKIPVTNKFKGNFAVHFLFIRKNRIYKESQLITVPYSDKKLDISFMTFRDKVEAGAKEKWTLKIRDHKGKKLAAEMLATLYDSSLDQFKPNVWAFDIYRKYFVSAEWGNDNFTHTYSENYFQPVQENFSLQYPVYPSFNWHGFHYFSNGLELYSIGSIRKNTLQVRSARSVASHTQTTDSKELTPPPSPLFGKNDFHKVKVRSNFNETAFFYPHLQTDKSGNILISFTLPESLTRWKMKGFATSKDLKYGFINKELTAQKKLMIDPAAPRFFRENDAITFPVKISNTTGKPISGSIKIDFFDALTMQPVSVPVKNDPEIKNFTISANGNTVIKWQLKIPEGISALQYKVRARTKNFSDGEQKIIPVLSNRILITETLPLYINGKESKEFQMKKLVQSADSPSVQNHKLTLEFCSSPIWYAIPALPYLMEYPHQCSEQIFNRYYAHSLGRYIVNQNPKIKAVFEHWKKNNSEVLISNLEKNEDLKTALLQETPWVRDGKNESDRKKRVGQLFDLNHMNQELARNFALLQKRQSTSGAWSWFPEMPESPYITRYIVCGMGHLLKLTRSNPNPAALQMIQKAIGYIDNAISKTYKQLQKNTSDKDLQKNHLSHEAVHYLYARSFFTSIPKPASARKAHKYYIKQAKKYWTSQNKYLQGMLALAVHRENPGDNLPQEILHSLKEHALTHPEQGMYWKEDYGWGWHQSTIERQALFIELFDEINRDTKSVEAMQLWLLKQKQVQDWKTTRATADAIYALLLTGNENTLTDNSLVEIHLGEQKISSKTIPDLKEEAGTGYLRTSWHKKEILPTMGKVKLKKNNKGAAWGALYRQYFEDLDKVTAHQTPLKLNKKLFVEKLTTRGAVLEPITRNTKLKPGNKIVVRIELRCDRTMQYIHLKDMRASGLEPDLSLSGYHYQDGLGYYQTPQDTSMDFFMEYLPKGTYILEYTLRTTHAGIFSNGITSIQSMYAPEFSAHSKGQKIEVKSGK